MREHREVRLRCRDVEWARQFVEPGTRSLFAYVLKRNAEFGVATTDVDAAEEYAVLRQHFSKSELERVFRVRFVFE